jgi:predicted phage terminase large subunit-like protein
MKKLKINSVSVIDDLSPWKDPRTKEGELLCVHRFGLKETAKYKKEMGSYGYAGQFQQRPAPQEGGIIKADWFQWWKKAQPPELMKILQSWDTAFKEGEQNDYSVCTTWGIFSSEQLEDGRKDPFEVYYNCAILLSMWRERVNYPDLRKRAMRLYENFTDTGDKPKKFKESNQPDLILIEDKASGQSLIQDLYRSGIQNIIRMDTAKYGDKVQRVHYVAPLLENNQVYLPALPPDFSQLRPTSKTLLEECINFPKSDHDDIVDTLSQMLIYCKRTQLLRITHDPVSSYEEPDSEGVQFF